MRISTDDAVELEVLDVGTGPTLVLVHGFGGAKEDFSDHLTDLARDHRVVAMDLRGHGESDGPEDEARYSLDRFAADIGNVVDGLGIDTFRLLGHSMGGMAARRFVLAEPARVDGLILMDTSPGPAPDLDHGLIDLGVQIANEQGMDELKRVMDAFTPLGTPSYDRVLRDRPGYVEFGDRKWAALARAMYTKMMVEVRDQPDQLTELAAVRCPTLVMVGEEDTRFIDVSVAMASIIPGAEYIVVPQSGHAPQFENGQAWLATLRGFLAKVSNSSPAI